MKQFLPRKRTQYSGHIPLPLILFGLSLSILIAAWMYWISNPEELQVVDLIAATLTPATLLFSLDRAKRGSEIQAVVDLVSKRFENEHYQSCVEVLSGLRMQNIITPATGLAEIFEIEWQRRTGSEPQLAAYALIPVLNYWEHLSTLYVNRILCRSTFEDLVQDLIRDLIGRYPVVIGDMRREDPSNMEHLCAVWFVLASPTERARLIPSLGPVPQRLCPDDQWRWSKIQQPC